MRAGAGGERRRAAAPLSSVRRRDAAAFVVSSCPFIACLFLLTLVRCRGGRGRWRPRRPRRAAPRRRRRPASAKKSASATMAVKSSMPAPSTASFTEVPRYSTLETMPVKPRPLPARSPMRTWSVRMAMSTGCADIARRAGRGEACRRSAPRASRAVGAPAARPETTLWSPMKRATKAVAGRSKTSRGGAACSIRPSFITTIEVGQRHRLVLAVGDVDEGDAEPRLQLLQLGAHADLAGTDRAPTAARRAAGPAGSVISARASATRCCWPPESWAGRRVGIGAPSAPASACRAPWRGARPCRRPSSSG